MKGVEAHDKLPTRGVEKKKAQWV